MADSPQFSAIEHSPAALDAWAEELRQRFDGRPIAVCLELQRGPIVSALLKHDIFVLYPVNPQSLARYRQAWSPSAAKDDPSEWIRVLYRCWQDRKPYDESIYLNALKRSSSPLLAFMAKDSASA